MANKSNILKSYLKDVGTKNQLFLMFGNTPNNPENNTGDSGIDVWKNSELSYRVGRKDTVAVIPNYTWSSGNVYNYWTSKTSNTNPFYAWNKVNGIVYLCISNNDLNRKDLSLTSASTYIPNHSSGIQRYADGYSWLALYKITADLLRFVTTTWIPVISFDDYRDNDNSRYTKSVRFCSNNLSQTGNCGIYFKKTSQIPSGVSTFTTYNAGDLYVSLTNPTCGQCFHLYENSEDFTSYFTTSTLPSTIQIKDKFDEIESLIQTNRLSRSSPYYSLYTMTSNGLQDGAIVSAFIDLSSFNQDNLVVSQANPEITISSSSGSGASLRFKTYVNFDGENIIEGVELVSNGQNYRDASLSIAYSKFTYLSAGQVDSLLAAIDLSLDTIDGLNFDPVAALGSENIMFDVRIETNVLKNENVFIPDEVNFYALVENPVENIGSGLEITAGAQFGKDYSYLESNTTVASLESGPVIIGEESVNIGDTTATTSTGATIKDMSVVKLGSSGGYSTVYLTGLNYDQAEDLSSITIDSVVYPIREILEAPVLKQYSGKVTQTKKLDNTLKLGNAATGTENTKIFRINIVKGF
jgi:hypothetical protein